MVEVGLVHRDDVGPIVPFIQGYHNVDWPLAVPAQIKRAGIREVGGIIFNALSGVQYRQDRSLTYLPLG